MNSKSSYNNTLNRSKSIANKTFLNENIYYDGSVFQKSSQNNTNQDIFTNNKYSDIADEQKHYINDLLRKLQLAKEERKLAEKNSKILEHRVVLLMNQEKLAVKKFHSTKSRLEQIVKNRKFFNEENKLKNLVQIRKKEEMDYLKEKSDNQRKNRTKIREERSLYTKLSRANTSLSPFFDNKSYSPKKIRMNNSKSTKILDNSFHNNTFSKNFSQNKNILIGLSKTTENSEGNILNNTISILNHNPKNNINSKYVFNDESSLTSKNTAKNGNINDFSQKENSKFINQKNFPDVNKNSVNQIKILNKSESNLNSSVDLGDKNEQDRYKKKRNNNLSCDFNQQSDIKYKNNIKMIKNLNDSGFLKEESIKKNNIEYKNDLSNKVKNNNIKLLNKTNSTGNLIDNHVYFENKNSTINVENNRKEQKYISQSKNLHGILKKYNVDFNENKLNMQINFNEKMNNNSTDKSTEHNLSSENKDLKESKENLNYRLYNEIKSIKKNMNYQQENYPKNQIIHIKNEKSKDGKIFQKVDKDAQMALNESLNKIKKKKFENSSVNFNVKNDKIIMDILDNVNRNYKKENKTYKDKNFLDGKNKIITIKDNPQNIYKKNVIQQEKISSPEKIKNGKYENHLLNKNNVKLMDKKIIAKENYEKEQIIDMKNNSYTLGPRETESIDINNLKEENYSNNKDETFNNNLYISKIGDKNIYKRETDITKTNDLKLNRKNLKKQNVEMIKKMKEVCMKNKISNQTELNEEEERRKKLDEKKTKLRSEILKQIDDDEKQKMKLEQELKKTQDDIINKKIFYESINNKFQNKDFIVEEDFNLKNFNNNVNDENVQEFVYKKSRAASVIRNSKKFEN